MRTYIALLRGINVGRAKRIAMAELRALVADLGHESPRTLLNSGNVVFEGKRAQPARLAAQIEAAILARCGFSSRVVVLAAAQLDAVIAENPLQALAHNHSQYLGGFASEPAMFEKLAPLAAKAWGEDRFVLGQHAAYLWCGKGILQSELAPSVMKVGGDTVTTRNWATVLKLQAAARGKS